MIPNPARFAALGAAVLLAVAACGAGDGDGGTASASSTSGTARATTTTAPFIQPAPVDGMLATIEISRLFSIDHALAIGLQNVGAEPRQVVRIGLETPLFEPLPLTERTVLLVVGGRELVMPVPYGAPRCDGAPADDEFTAVVVFDDGSELRLEAPERHPGGIGRQHDRECAAAEVRERIDLRFGDEWVPDPANPRAVIGELVLEQRTPGPPASVDEMSGTVIFGLAVEGDPPILSVTDDEPVARAPVVVSAERCDPHALIEAKKAFVFLAWVIIDGADESVPIEVQPAGPARAALDALLATCLD